MRCSSPAGPRVGAGPRSVRSDPHPFTDHRAGAEGLVERAASCRLRLRRVDLDTPAAVAVALLLLFALAFTVLVDVVGVLDADPLAGRGLDSWRCLPFWCADRQRQGRAQAGGEEAVDRLAQLGHVVGVGDLPDGVEPRYGRQQLRYVLGELDPVLEHRVELVELVDDQLVVCVWAWLQVEDELVGMVRGEALDCAPGGGHLVGRVLFSALPRERRVLGCLEVAVELGRLGLRPR